MRSIINTLKRFLCAEEVPRWFGFSVVLIYLLGLGAATQLGVDQARKENVAYHDRSSAYAVELLAKRLESVATNVPSTNATYRHELSKLAAVVSARSLRIVDSAGEVVVALGPDELGSRQNADADLGSETRDDRAGTGGVESRIHRVPIRVAAQSLVGAAKQSGPPDSQAEAVLFLEAIVSPRPLAVTGTADQARLLSVILVVLGVLFVLFRCLRGQLRSARRIAEQLTTHRDELAEELESLRISGTVDAVTASWNDLIDLTQRLSQSVERSEADNELSQALQKSGSGALAEALDCIPDGIMYLTDATRFEYVNASARRLLGWGAARTDSKAGATLTSAEADGLGGLVLDLVRGSLQDDGTYRSVTEVVNEEGSDSASVYRVRVIALSSAQRFGECVVVIRDVSQQTRAERSREEFITQVTHELRTPLTNIRAYAETLSSGMFDDPAVVTECYNVITRETRRLSRLIEDILSVSQLDAGSIELHIDQVDLKALLDEAVRDARGSADEKNIDLQLILPAKLEPVRADRDKLAVVINNLLGNAIKYTPADGNVVVGCQCTIEETTITIKDNGVGIDPSEQGKVFEKFVRSQDAAVQSEPGTGIGLYTAREIMRHHYGDIDLVSEKGKGSTFLARLPRQATRATSLTTVEEAQ